MQLSSIVLTSNATALYISAAAIVLTIVYYVLQTRGLPPGPMGIPFIGYWPFMKANICHIQLQELGKKYGDVFSFTVTGHLYVNLASNKVLKEAHLSKSEYFAIRTTDFNLLRHVFKDGVAFISGEEWRVLRKFFTQKFREQGFTTFKDSDCGPIYDNIRDCTKELLSSDGVPVNITDILYRRCNHILRLTLFGEHGITEQEVQEINESYEIILMNMTGTNLLLIGSFARYFMLPFTSGYPEAMKSVHHIVTTMCKVIDRHKSNYREANVRDIIDIYIKERNDRQSRQDPTAQYFTDKALMATLIQFVGDGVLTVAVFVCAFFKALLDYPEEQEKIYKELIDVVGEDRDPSIEDKNKLHYTNAFILEVVRTCDVFPFFPKMECIKDTTVGGYRIPKGAITLQDSWSAHYDPNEYDEPNRFNPSRFVVPEGKRRPEPPILFGLGKRACIGEGFAMAQAFLFVTTIIKHFRLSKPADVQDKLLFLVGKIHVCAKSRFR